MADDMVPVTADKLKDNELIYFGTLLCDLLTELESDLKNYFKDDQRLKLLLSIKTKWIETFTKYN